MSREKQIARSIVKAIIQGDPKDLSVLSRILAAISAFFAIYRLSFIRVRNDLFHSLRSSVWHIDDGSYLESFGDHDTDHDTVHGPLEAKGDLGYSGSTFFNTADKRYLIKSVPRRFENTFFRDDFLLPYVQHMEAYPKSLIVRITDFLSWKFTSLGGLLGFAPTHHIVMENLLFGQEEGQAAGGEKWQTFDLKPADYFFPERDIAGGNLASDATKDRLVDLFDGKIVLTRLQVDELMAQLEKDTKLLEESNAVDYSLFLVRIPLSAPQDPFADDADHDNAPRPPRQPPLAPPSPPTWRTGIRSADDKYVFRAIVLDFLWAKHKLQARLFTILIKCWNFVNKQGPMSITTTPEEYRTRFLKMCAHIVEVKE